jgi:hypothetical protein
LTKWDFRRTLTTINIPENNPELSNTKLPLAMDRQQAEVFELLFGFSTQEKHFHKWYQGAIEIINSQSPDKIAQAAHSLRELCDELPSAIAGIPKFVNPISAAKPLGPHFLAVKAQSYRSGWKGEIVNQPLDEVLRCFEKLFNEPARHKLFGRALTAADPQADFLPKDWHKDRDKVFEKLYGFVQNVAHHNHLATETELIEKIKLFESLLLNYLTPCTAAQQKELLELMAAPANSETFARVSDLILHKTANFTFFFDKLENPDWLLLLDQKGLFKNLPGPEPTDNGRIMYRHHLPLMVLTRLAGSVPQVVTGILVKLRLPDNPYVGDQILQCASKIRDPACIQQLHPVIAQLAENSTSTSWLWIQELLKSWMELKVFPEIFAILRAYLNSAVDKSFEQHRDVSGTWLAKQIDEKYLEELTRLNSIEIATIVFQALCKWVEQEREKHNESEIGDDAPFSYFVEDFKSSPLEHQGIEATLAKRLFSAAEQIYLRGDLAAIDQLDKLLSSNPWQLFRRLRWQLYADFPTLTLERARAEVLQRIPFLNEIDYGRGSHDYEFAQLLLAHAKQHGDAFLSPNEVEQFANAVLKGPIDKDGKLLEGDNNFFYRTQLWPISSLLRGEQLTTYRVFVPDDSQINITSFKPFSSGGVSGGFVASIAPKQAEALESMNDEELWNFLNTWEPKAGYEYNSTGKLQHENVFELATKFAELVEKLPQRFDPAAKWWKNINRSEVLDKFLDRAADRVSKKPNDEKTSALTPTESEWANWFGITQWVMAQPWPRHASSRFLRNTLKSECVIPDRYFPEMPELLRQLIVEVDPQLSANKNSFGDWHTTAINSVRGKAIEALLNLASRQKNADKKIEPWIFELIRSRLELPEESPAIFALFGTNLRFLIHLFRQELKDSPSLLFPPDRPEHRSAIITAHFKYDQPWNAILEIFPKFLNDALDILETMQADTKDDDAKQNRRDFGSRLGTHIACYYWSGSFATDSDGEVVLDRFFDVASRSTRATLISQIAWIWEKHNGEPSDEKVIGKVLRIWERRYAQIEKKLKLDDVSSEYDGELAESIDWLSCECFPFEWRFNHAKLALKRLKKAPQAYRLMKAITEYSVVPERLESMLDLFKALLKKQSGELRWSIQFKELAPVISLGLASDKSSTKKLAGECKDLLLRMGFSDFLNLGI